ncbi:MAG: hypothetical protein QM528_03795 [Phycisphaerales bacterium]|nr:hypothetical protein [Phycisphaerales bacterium]
MKYSQVIGILSILLIIALCNFTWIIVPSSNKIINGFNGQVNEYLDFGKPAYLYLFLGLCMMVCFLLPWIITKRINVFLGFFNLSWAIRNTAIFSICRQGECPLVKLPLYIILILSLNLFVMTLMPKLKV